MEGGIKRYTFRNYQLLNVLENEFLVEQKRKTHDKITKN